MLKSLPHNVTIFRDSTFKEVIKFKLGDNGGGPCPTAPVSYKREKYQGCTCTEKGPCEETVRRWPWESLLAEKKARQKKKPLCAPVMRKIQCWTKR